MIYLYLTHMAIIALLVYVKDLANLETASFLGALKTYATALILAAGLAIPTSTVHYVLKDFQ